MKTYTVLSTRKVAENSARVAGWAVVTAALGAAGAALYGLIFGGLAALVVNEPRGIVSIAAYFALCGTISGALVGAFGAIVLGEVEGESEVASDSNRDGRIFLRPRPRINPLIARWRFLERTAVDGALAQKNSAAAHRNGTDVRVNGAAIEASPAPVRGPGAARYQLHTSRSGAGDEYSN